MSTLSMLRSKISELRAAQLGARLLYVAAIALLFLVPGLLTDTETRTEVLLGLVLPLLLSLGLVGLGLLVETRGELRAARAAS